VTGTLAAPGARRERLGDSRDSRTTAVVMCGGGHGAYDIVRALGYAGIASTVFASHAGDIALRSRYARGSLFAAGIQGVGTSARFCAR